MKTCALVLVTCLLAACNRPAPTADTGGTPATQATAQAPPPAPSPPSDPADGIPERFLGAWASDAAACTTAGHESRLTIAADSLGFHESRGPVESITVDGDDLGVVVTLTGEGQTRQAAYRFTLSDAGNTLTDRESGLVRRRCDG